MRYVGLALAAAPALLLTLSASSCTAIVKLEDHGDVTNRCIVDLDCSSKNAGSACGPNHTCVPIDGYCATNKECIQRAGSEAYFCQRGAEPKDNACKALLTATCPTLLADPGDTANDDMILLGTPWMTWTPVLHGGQDGIELARRDFRSALGGLPPIPGHKDPRPIVVVACNVPLSHQDQIHDAIDHLVDIDVKATIGPLSGSWINYAITKGSPKKMAVFTTDSSSPGFQGDTHDLLVTNGNPPGAALRALIVPQLEAILRAQGKTGDVKVAMGASGLATDQGSVDLLFQHLVFNGKSALDNGKNYQEFDFGDTRTDGASSATLASAVAAMVAFNPDIVLLASSEEFAIDAIEASIHPLYSVGPSASTSSLAAFLDTQPNGTKRLLGERPGRPTSDHRLATFINRFNATFPEDQGQYGLGAQNYDLFYYLAYGIASLPPDKPFVGQDIGHAVLTKFVQGATPASTTPASIIGTVQKLQSGATVDMDGTGTIGDFQANGELVYAELTVWCFDPDPNVDSRTKDSGLTFRTDQPGVLQGKLTCF